MSVVQTDKELIVAPTTTDGNNLFPVFIKLEGLTILIVGGGNVGLEKLHAVLHNAPATKIRLVAITINAEIKGLASKHANIELIEAVFENTMLEGVDLVIAAVNDIATSEAIRNAAKALGKLINVAYKPEL
jgi:siroheme synthase-like protein